jgi:2-polyprenyl-3-methyl-5-hydroxy-6-metoxy-1,4-benzoquinol methylase
VPARATRVLDVGCSTGLLGAALRTEGHVVTGIEVDPALAQEAHSQLDEVIEGDVEVMASEGRDPGGPFDCIVLADVLEHLRNPWAVVRWAEGLLATDGTLVASVPNVRHAETFWSLLVRRRWPYKDVGIFDRTHLRFFARRNLPELFSGTSLEIVTMTRQYMLRPGTEGGLNRLAPFLGDLGTMQFIVTAQRVSRSEASQM